MWLVDRIEYYSGMCLEFDEYAEASGQNLMNITLSWGQNLNNNSMSCAQWIELNITVACGQNLMSFTVACGQNKMNIAVTCAQWVEFDEY